MQRGWKLAGLGLATLGLGLYALGGLGQLRPQGPILLWFVLVLAQEQRACRLPGLGFFSLTQPFWLTLALAPSSGPALAVLAASVALTLRSLFQGSPDLQQRFFEVLCEALPVMAALGAVQVLLSGAHPWLHCACAAALVYSLVMLVCQELLSAELPHASRPQHSEVRSALLGLMPVIWASALALLGSSQHSEWLPPLLIAFLAAQLPRMANALLYSDEDRQRGNLMRQMERQQKEQQVLEVASRSLVQVRTLQQTGAEILGLCSQLCQTQSVAVFLWQEGALRPLACHSPHQSRLGPGWSEPVVEAAYRRGEMQVQPQAASPQRVFLDETQVLALPLGGLGVLYLGRTQSAFSPQELRYLRQAANQGGLALQIAAHMESLQLALGQQAAWAGTLNQLLYFSAELSERLEPEQLCQKVAQAAGALVPHDFVQVILFRPEGQPLASAGGWQNAASELPSRLQVAIVHPELPGQGQIRVGSTQSGVYFPMHQDGLQLLASLAAVAWKNSQLRQQQLQAQAHLAQSSKLASVGQLAAGIAHEINTPLGSINLNLDLALRNLQKPAEAEKRLLKSKEMIAAAREIIEKLLTFSRHDPDSGAGPTTSADLNLVVEQTLSLFGQSLDLQGIELKTQLQSGLPAAPMVVNQIQQVLLNLLLNARDAVRLGGRPEILIATATQPGWVGLAVSDGGPGLDESIRERIFDPFFTTKPVGQGTGLGLTVARQIMQAHQGRLEVKTTPTTFELWLPC
jgi:signal transduction histidine kinase